MFLFDVTSLWRIPVRVFRRIVPIAPTTGHLYCIRRSAPIVHTHTHIFNSRRRENDVSSSTGEMAIWEKQVLRSAGATAWSWTAHGGFRRYAYIYTTNNKMPAQKIDLGYQSRKTWWRPKVAEGPSLGRKVSSSFGFLMYYSSSPALRADSSPPTFKRSTDELLSGLYQQKMGEQHGTCSRILYIFVFSKKEEEEGKGEDYTSRRSLSVESPHKIWLGC